MPSRSGSGMGVARRCVLAALLACAPLAAVAAEPLRLAVARGPVSLLVYVAEAKGYFADAGLDLRSSDCASGRACFEQLQAGAADVATAAELLATLASFRDGRHAVLASLSSSVHQIKLVARRSAGIAAPADLRGRRIGTVAGTSAQYFLDTWLLYHGIDARETTLAPMAPERLADALARREVDAVAVWEPHASEARTALAGDEAALPSPRVYTQHFTLIGTRDALAARPAALHQLLLALARAQALVAARPQEARAILSARLQLAPERAEAQLREHDFRLRLDQTLVVTMDNQARWAVHAGLAEPRRSPGNLLRAIEPSLLARAVPGAVELVRERQGDL